MRKLLIISIYVTILQVHHRVLSASVAEQDETVCRCLQHELWNDTFPVIWNVPTHNCIEQFGVRMPVSNFSILTTPEQDWYSQYVTIFYRNQLGAYPFVEFDGQLVNGGIPQNINITDHLIRCVDDITKTIADPSYSGYAVIDWEDWRPVWETNWGDMNVYKDLSKVRASYKKAKMNEKDLEQQARQEFARSARLVLTSTLLLGQALRPAAKWGFYGIPDCYHMESNFFQCTNTTKAFHDEIDWLLEKVDVLFPSLYLQNKVNNVYHFVVGRMRETYRLANRVYQRTHRMPFVVPYFRYLLLDEAEESLEYLSKEDLVLTFDVPALMGADAIIIWGSKKECSTRAGCLAIEKNLVDHLGPHVLALKDSLEVCRKRKCGDQGRCVGLKHFTANWNETERLLSCTNPKKVSPISRAANFLDQVWLDAIDRQAATSVKEVLLMRSLHPSPTAASKTGNTVQRNADNQPKDKANGIDSSRKPNKASSDTKQGPSLSAKKSFVDRSNTLQFHSGKDNLIKRSSTSSVGASLEAVRRFMVNKKIHIVIGSLVFGLTVIGLIVSLSVFLRKKQWESHPENHTAHQSLSSKENPATTKLPSPLNSYHPAIGGNPFMHDLENNSRNEEFIVKQQ